MFGNGVQHVFELLARILDLFRPKLRWERRLIQLFEEDKWDEAAQIFAERDLVSSPTAARLAELIKLNRGNPTIVFVDIESDPFTDEIWEIGAIRKRGTVILKTFHSYVSTSSLIPRTKLNEKEMRLYEKARDMKTVRVALLEFIGTAGYIAGHNILFDIERIQEPEISSKPLIDTLELGFLVWPTRFSHTLADLVGKEEIHRAVEDSLMTVQLYDSITESLRKMAPDRQRIILAACREERVRNLLSETLEIAPLGLHEILELMISAVDEQRRMMWERHVKLSHSSLDPLTTEIDLQIKQCHACLIAVDGCVSHEDQIRSAITLGQDSPGLNLLVSPRDLFRDRTMASRLLGFEQPIPQIAIRSKLRKICPRRLKEYCHMLPEQDADWRCAFFTVVTWVMESPECYVDEFNYGFKQKDKWINTLLLELSQHYSDCPSNCGYDVKLKPSLTIVDGSLGCDFKGTTIIPESHSLEEVLTDSSIVEISSDVLEQQIDIAANYLRERMSEQMNTCQNIGKELTNSILQFVKNRDLHAADDRRELSFRILDFHTKSSDWEKVSSCAQLLTSHLENAVDALQEIGKEPIANAISETMSTVAKLFGDIRSDRVRWFTVIRDEDNTYRWRARDALINVKNAINDLATARSTIFVTSCASTQKATEFLLTRWGLDMLHVSRITLTEKPWPKIASLTFLPRPSRLNLLSFITRFSALTNTLIKSFFRSELSLNSRTTLNVIRQTLRRTNPQLAIISRTEWKSHRRAVADAAKLSAKQDTPFVFLDQTFLLRKKERKVNPNLVLVERVPTPLVADPVTSARFELEGGGLDAYEGFALPQSALALSEVISYAGENSAHLVVCDNRLAKGGSASLLGQYLPSTPIQCENLSELEKLLGLHETALSSFNDDSLESMIAPIVRESLKEEGLTYGRDLSDLDPLAYLKALFGHESFREGQAEIIRQILGRKDTFAVMPTGYGKSICYQIPAIAFSLVEEGLTLIISPLQALMRDQVQSLQRHGILRATCINASISPMERAQRLRGIRNGWYNLLYLAPEQLRNPGTLEAIQSRDVVLVVIDEAHCLSHWGHDFRPDYMHVASFLNHLPYRPVVAAFTATATEQTVQDVKNILRIEQTPIYLSPHRKNITLETVRIKSRSPPENEGEKRKSLLEIIKRLGPDKNGIIYCAYTRTTEELASYLKNHAREIGRSPDEIAFFHGKIANNTKTDVQDRFIGKNQKESTPIKIVIATNAFGLGVDKSDIHFIIHYDIPGTIEAYYQEVGRAGRDSKLSATGTLMFLESDLDKQRFLASTRIVDERDIIYVHDALMRMKPSPDGNIYVSTSDLTRHTALDDVALRVAVYQLEKNGLVERGPNIISPVVLKTHSESEKPHVVSSSDSRILCEYLEDKLSRTEWRTIHLDKIATDLDWKLSRTNNALRDLLRDKQSPISRQRNFEITITDPEKALNDLETVYASQISLLHAIAEQYEQFRSGIWAHIRRENWPHIIQAVAWSGPKLSRVDCAQFFRMWSDLDLVAYRNELSKDSMKLMIPLEQAERNLQASLETDRMVINALQLAKSSHMSVDGDFLENLSSDPESVDASLRRLNEFNLIQMTHCYSSGTCMSLRLSKNESVTPKDLDISSLKKIQREREHKLELMAKYATLSSDQERWHFVEEYFAGKLRHEPRSDIIAGLNPQQIEAVTAPAGLLLINAGAGTGKTEVVARRILYITEELCIPPGQVLAMTFSKSGVAQLKERMAKIMPNRRIDIRTYHSLAYEILRAYAGEKPLWIRSGFEVENTEALMSRIRQTLDSLDDGIEPGERIARYSKAIQKLLSLRQPPSPSEVNDDLALKIDGEFLSAKNLRRVYQDYIQFCKQANSIDYSLMISLAVDLLRKRPDILRDYQRRIAYLVIDEYQDTTPIQDELLSLLSNWYGNLCVVGDSDQTIFAWSNADVRNILDFSKRNKDAKTINLEINYRSTQNILDVSNRSIEHNKERIPKQLTAYRKVKGLRVVIHSAENDSDLGADYVCRKIKENLAAGTNPQNIAILTKTNDQVTNIMKMMKTQGIPASVPEEQIRIVKNPKAKQILVEMEKIARQTPHLSALAVYANIQSSYSSKDIPGGFEELIREFDQDSEDNSCQAFLNLMNASTGQDTHLDKKNAVRVMTIHKSKGLEFDDVFVTYLRSGSFPRFDVSVEEERRVFYVAMTRARNRLYILSSTTRPSSFIAEIAQQDAVEYFPQETPPVRTTRHQRRGRESSKKPIPIRRNR